MVEKVIKRLSPFVGSLWLMLVSVITCTWGFSAYVTKHLTLISSDISVINQNIGEIKTDISVLKTEVAEIKINTTKNTVRIEYLEKKCAIK